MSLLIRITAKWKDSLSYPDMAMNIGAINKPWNVCFLAER